MRTKKPIKTNTELLVRAQAGDRRAFDLLMQPYINPMTAQIWHLVKRREDINDILQMALLNAWRYLHTFRGDCELSTWLYRVVHNCAMNFFNMRDLHVISLEVAIENNQTTELADHATPETILESNQEAARIELALGTLSRKLAEAFRLREFELLSYQDIAEIQCVSINTVRSRIRRARERVRIL
jgi:RNA polymerase sigma-70 factor (ECF subfamily)